VNPVCAACVAGFLLWLYWLGREASSLASKKILINGLVGVCCLNSTSPKWDGVILPIWAMCHLEDYCRVLSSKALSLSNTSFYQSLLSWYSLF